MNYKVLGVFGLIFLTAIVTYKFSAAPSVPVKPANSIFVEVSEISPEMTGLTRETRGIVTDLNEAKGHVFFTLKDANTDRKIRAVMFAKTNADDPNRKQILLRSRENRAVVYLKGEIDVYRGELEIKTWQVFNDD